MEFTNSLKKYIRSLHLRKHRQKYNKFIAEGPKVCKEFLMCNTYEIEFIFATKEWIDANNEILAGHESVLIPIKSKELQQVSLLKTANQVLIVVNQDQALSYDSTKWSIYLDCIQDPGNMGTIIRIADWFGVNAVVASGDSVDFYNPKVVQSAMGSHNRIVLMINSLSELVSESSLKTYGLVLDGQDLSQVKSQKAGIIVIGNESQGIKPALLSQLDHSCTIPRKGGAESLNAGIACGIACQQLVG